MPAAQRRVGAPARRRPRRCPDLLAPADVAKLLGVPEADVMSIIESGELKAKKIGASLPHQAQRARRVPGEVGHCCSEVHGAPAAFRPRSNLRADRTGTDTMPDITALANIRAPPAARRRSGTPPSSCWCARSAAPRRRSRSTRRPAQIEELDLAKALRELPDEQRGWHDREAHRPVPELQGGHGLRSGRGSARTASSADRRRWSTTTEIKAPIRPQSLLPFKVIAGAGPRADSRAGTPASGSRRTRSSARRWSIASTASTSRTGPSTPRRVCPWTGGGGPLLLHDRDDRDNNGRSETRQVRHVRWEPAAGRGRSLLRR